uniref:C-C motif chemokine n=2 Tax=Otolemur garnettii TaxID=30611 RepID=H0WNP6_OTOGA
MKSSAGLLGLLLVVAAFSPQGHAQPEALSAPTTCCFTFSSRKIPLQKLKSYCVTSSQCQEEAVIFRTKLNKEVCAKLKERWVQNYMRHLEQKPTLRR